MRRGYVTWHVATCGSFGGGAEGWEGSGGLGGNAEGCGGMGGLRRILEECGGCRSLGTRAEGRGEMGGMRRFRGECGRAWKSGRVAEVWGGVRPALSPGPAPAGAACAGGASWADMATETSWRGGSFANAVKLIKLA